MRILIEKRENFNITNFFLYFCYSNYFTYSYNYHLKSFILIKTKNILSTVFGIFNKLLLLFINM